jgi:hypothetical protein
MQLIYFLIFKIINLFIFIIILDLSIINYHLSYHFNYYYFKIVQFKKFLLLS